MTIGEAFKNLYENGLKVTVLFIKNDGSEREMTVKRDCDMEVQCSGRGAPELTGNKLRVCELGPNGSQWRTVNLDTIKYFTVNAEA